MPKSMRSTKKQPPFLLGSCDIIWIEKDHLFPKVVFLYASKNFKNASTARAVMPQMVCPS